MRFSRGTYVIQHRAPRFDDVGARAQRRALTYQAFVPSPIAGLELAIAGATAADLADAERQLERLRLASASLNGLEAVSRSLLRSESVASSWIEALRVSHRGLAEAEHGAPGARSDEARRVVGNLRAMLKAVELGAHEGPFAPDDLLTMHGMLMSTSSLPADVERAGKVRDEAVFIGGTTPANADYVGPPPEDVPRLLDDLVIFINDRQDLSGVAVAALAHAQFETIHPFHDGNGRVGRCLIHAILRRRGLTDAVTPPVSVILARMGSGYVDGLNAFRADDLDSWISRFAVAITQAAQAAVAFGERLDALESDWLARVQRARAAAGRRSVRADAAITRLVCELPGMPVFQHRDVADRLGVSWPAAQGAIDELSAAGVIRNVSAGKRNRVWEALEVFDVLESFEEDPDAFVRGA